MTAATTVTSVLRSSGADGSAGVVECEACGIALRPVEAVDEDVALGTFLQHHPASSEAVHRQDVPTGWSAVTVLPD